MHLALCAGQRCDHCRVRIAVTRSRRDRGFLGKEMILHETQRRCEYLQKAIADSGLEPKVLWEIIDAAATAHVAGREGAGAQLLLQTWITKFEENFDNFSDSNKATQMEAVHLSEREIRKAADYGPEVAARVGPSLYSQLHEATQQRLNAAEHLYHVNRKEPMYSHGAVLSLAFAYENELKFQLAYPIVNNLANTGVETYPAEGKDGKKPYRPLIAGAKIQHENMALGSIAWHLGQADFRKRASAATRRLTFQFANCQRRTSRDR